MQAFRFPLQKALEWRRTRLELEESQLRQSMAELAQLDVSRMQLTQVKARAEQSVRQTAAVEARDLWALAAYRTRLLAELQALAQRRRQQEQQVSAQRQKVMEAQRQCRLLEKLEERRRAEWRRAEAKETELLASESFLARWKPS